MTAKILLTNSVKAHKVNFNKNMSVFRWQTKHFQIHKLSSDQVNKLKQIVLMTNTGKPTQPKRVENNASARRTNLTSASCDLDLWPSDPEVECFMLLPVDHLCHCAEKSVHPFLKYHVHKFHLLLPPVNLTCDLLTPKVDCFMPLPQRPLLRSCIKISSFVFKINSSRDW